VSVETHQSDADRLGVPDHEFDIVYAGNLLHHVDLEKTIRQIHRCLKPGGKLVSWDPLCHNPVINVYRRMAAGVRTEDEHPLRVRDLEVFRRYFFDVSSQCFWFSTPWIFLRLYLIERVHPSQERYWKKIIKEHERLTPLFNRLNRIDRWLLRCCPYLKRYCWNITVCATKA